MNLGIHAVKLDPKTFASNQARTPQLAGDGGSGVLPLLDALHIADALFYPVNSMSAEWRNSAEVICDVSSPDLRTLADISSVKKIDARYN